MRRSPSQMDASAVLRKQYVAFAAHAHAVLTARIKAIQSTAGDLCGSVDRLRERLQSAMDDERALAGRFDACDKLMGSLEERLTISADLLDSLPRPLRWAARMECSAGSSEFPVGRLN